MDARKESSRWVDVFNGDADGLCSLQQLRLAQPLESELVTGVKRDVQLLERVSVSAGDRVTVLDISAESNGAHLRRLLDEGAVVTYFDHHACGELPRHPNFHATIDLAGDVCTSLLVDRFLNGAYRAWAIVGAYGDNLTQVADAMAERSGVGREKRSVLRSLGECLNYNGYGDRLEDLLFHPAELYRSIAPHADPSAFAAASSAFAQLREGCESDVARARRLKPAAQDDRVAAYVLPDAAWSRRVTGTFANLLANAAPARAHAVLTPNHTGNYTVSVRAPKANPTGASAFCKRFPTGGGREAAAGINALPPERVAECIALLREAYSR